MKLALIVFLWMVIAGFGFGAAGNPQEDDEPVGTAAAEVQLVGEIRRVFLNAQTQFRMKGHARAEHLFADCYALCQASLAHLSRPEDVTKVMAECERHLELLGRKRKFEAAQGRWQARLEALKFEQFLVRDAGLAATLEYFRNRVAKAAGEELPNFVFSGKTEKLDRVVSLDLKGVNALVVLQELAFKAGWVVRFEKEAIVFSETAKTL